MRIGIVVFVVGLFVVGVRPGYRSDLQPSSVSVTSACGPVPKGYARCLAEWAKPRAAAGIGRPIGLSPATIKAAYQWPTRSSLGAGQTIAIVTAFDAPTMEADLAVFDSQYGLPSCTATNGCFTTLNTSGTTSPLPATDAFWAFETHIDVEWAHAIAPGAKIVLIEATDNQFGHLLAGMDEAKTLANYVSGSFGSPEAGVETAFDHHFYEAPNVSWFFASGDTGSTTLIYPATSPYVVAVGGTMLQLVNGQFEGEVGWSGSGGGCSPYETASPAQAGFTQYKRVGCAGHRAVPDLALDGAPATGASVYNSEPDENNLVGWFSAGGTSLASPMAAAHAAGRGVLINQNAVYGLVTPGAGLGLFFRDVVQGNNGYLAGPGYDLVTGRAPGFGSGCHWAIVGAIQSGEEQRNAPKKTGSQTPPTCRVLPSAQLMKGMSWAGMVTNGRIMSRSSCSRMWQWYM